MARVRQLVVFFLLVPIAEAQITTSGPAEVTGIEVSEQETEVRIELSTTAPVPASEVIATYPHSLTLDLPGAVYRALPRRIRVNRAGVRAVRLWMQSENPPLTRVVVEIDRTEQYLLSSDGNAVVLRVGPILQPTSQSTPPNTAEVFGSRRAAPAGRRSASASAAGALAGIFRRGPGKPAVSGNSKTRMGQAVPQDDSAAKAAQSQNPSQNTAAVSAQSPNAAAKSPDEPAGQDRSVSDMAGTPKPADAVSAPNQPPQQTSKEEQSPAVVDQSAKPAVSVEKSKVAAEEAPAPTSVTAAISSSAAAAPEADSTKAPQDASAANTGPSSGASPPSAASTEPATPISTQDMRALPAIANPGMRTEFNVKYVEQDSAYLDGGRSSGLTEGMKLIVKNQRSAPSTKGSANFDGPVAELVVVALAETSAVTEIHAPKREVVPGDIAYLSSEDLQVLVQQHALSPTRKYPAVISFSEGGDALDEEARADVPRRPLPSVNRARGRIGFDYMGTHSNGASQVRSSNLGVVFRADFTRIGGSYWNLRGYWRGRLNSHSTATQPTLQDLINRTYHLSLAYENPNSHWVAGVGRLLLPWATSLDTIDGGYFGRRLGHGTTAGIFGGSTPDPTSWNYNPTRHLGGAFLNAEGGSFDAVHYSSISGFGKSFAIVQYSTTTPTGTSTASYRDNRPFAFLENSISYKRTFSIFHALQADQPSANPAAVSPGAGISRSFLTVRLQPVSRIEFSANHTYFRDIPTFDPRLVGTGLLDKYLFQGFSGAVRIEVVKNIALYSDLGRSSRTGDAKTSLNQMYGITFLRVPKVDLRADAHYSRFTSSFGSGIYRSFSLSRNLGEGFHLELLGGDQSFTFSLAGNQSAKFLTTTADTSLGGLFFFQGGFTMYRGQLQNYNQWFLTLGYRFDSRGKRK